MTKQHQELAIVTCSYGPDAQRCKRLCQSIDRFVDEDIEHHLIVPKRDLHLFTECANARRKIHTVESVLHSRFRQVPIANKWWLYKGLLPVRGWILQQITKLAADEVTRAENIVFADSDLQFTQPLDASRFSREGSLRLHAIAGDMDTGRHLGWHHRAANLLGIEPRYFDNDYVGQLISWRRSTLQRLKAHLQKQSGKRWDHALATTLDFSEYILYGVFAQHVLGTSEAGHFVTDDPMCHCFWDTNDVAKAGTKITPAAIAIHIQSNLNLSLQQEHALLLAQTASR
ncbi:DUF6492 family protein [Marinobacter alexandrii]|uniref:DUF6492 family protein n=1 Tax=Marinobacter alexandrii TaxID=2570351 RepID=UPI00329A4E62